jgi:hypothetical protein
MADPPGSDPLAAFWADPEVLARQLEEPAGKSNGATPGDAWGEPDMGVLRLQRRPPPPFPLDVLGDAWSEWITEAAAAAACPVDYVALPLLSSASALIGNARWAQATPGWREPPHLWIASVGDSGDGKSPGFDCLMRDVLPAIERRMVGDFPDRLEEWRAAAEFDKAAEKLWRGEVKQTRKEGRQPPPPPHRTASDIEPQIPRLRQHDVTIEQVATILATAAPKGVMIVRDELAGWLDGMNAYNPAGRPFWIEAYGGRPYRVERCKHGATPIEIPRHAVSVYGGTQPDKLAQLIKGADDGLLARIQWGWPDSVPFYLGRETPRVTWAVEALDRLRELELQPGDPPYPFFVSLTPDGQKLIEEFGREMQDTRANAGGLLRSAYGKARGTALRLSLVLEELWWCGQDDSPPPLDTITTRAFVAAATMVAGYFMPMAERVFGDAGATETERTAATLARWIEKERPPEVYVRQLLREIRLPGLRTAEHIKKAANALIEADWLRPPAKTVVGQPRSRVAYSINPRLYEV